MRPLSLAKPPLSPVVEAAGRVEVDAEGVPLALHRTRRSA